MSTPAEIFGCPDGGACHHHCDDGACFRVVYAEPLTDVYPGDRWPPEMERRHVLAEHKFPALDADIACGGNDAA